MPAIANPYIRIGLVWLGMTIVWLSLAAARDAIFGPDYSFGGHVLSAVLATLLAVPMVIAARRHFDGGTLEGLGLPLSAAAFKTFAIGALAFLLPSAAGFALVLGFGWATVTPIAPLWEILLFVPLLIVLVILYEALPEELAFRGYIYRALAERHARIVAVFAQAVLFALWGTASWTFVSGAIPLDRLVLFFAVAFVLGLVRVMTGSVWTTIGLHTAFQTVAQLVLSEGRDHFAIEGTNMLQLLALGIVPFALATTVVGWFYGGTIAWREPEGKSIR